MDVWPISFSHYCDKVDNQEHPLEVTVWACNSFRHTPRYGTDGREAFGCTQKCDNRQFLDFLKSQNKRIF